MRSRFALALAALLLTGPAMAEPPKPAVVVQTKPMARLLADYREMIRQIAGPVEGDAKVKHFDNELKELLGEQGFEGLDINRPVALYIVFTETIEDAKIVVVAPVSGEKEFVGFLERLKIKAEPIKDRPGAYSLAGAVKDLFDKPSHLQFAPGGWAYVEMNTDQPIDPKDLVAPGDLLDNADPSLYSARVFPRRVPEKLVKHLLDQFDMSANAFKGFAAAGLPRHVGKMVGTILDEGPKLIRRYGETGLKEVEELTMRFNWDQATGDTRLDLGLVPNAGSPLAKEIAAIPATTNRFAGLVPKNAAAGITFKAPLFAQEIQEIAAALLEAGKVELTMGDLPEAFHPIADEIASGLIRSVKKGQLDGAIAMLPSKGDHFTVVGGVSCDDPSGAEKELRKAGQLAALVKLFEFDVAKVGAVSIHKVPFHRGIPAVIAEDFAKVFGQDAPGYVAFAKDAVFAAYGPDALEAIKTALAVKTGPAPAFDLVGNMKSIHKLVSALGGEKPAALFSQHVGTDDRAASLVRVTIERGKNLTARIEVNLRYLPRAVIIGEAIENDVKPPLR